MTGMFASFAFWSAGRIAFWSWASSTRTFAPFEIRVSTSESWRWLSRLASASMNVPPPASMVCFIFGLSVAPHRGCWKLFHETPTMQPLALPPADGLPPALVHAVITTAAARTAATLRICTDISSLMGPCSLRCRRVFALGYDLRTPLSNTQALEYSSARQDQQVAGRQPARRIGQERLEGQFGCAEQWGVNAQRGRHDANELAGSL